MRLLMTLCLAALAAASCSRTECGGVILLRESYAGSSERFRTALSNAIATAGLSLAEVDGAHLAARLESDPGPCTILMLSDARFFPLDAKRALEAFLKRGNHLVAVSGPAFGEMVVHAGDKWLTREQAREALAGSAGTPIFDFGSDDLARWRRISGDMGNRTERAAEPSGDPRVPNALHVRMSKLDSWDVLLSPTLSKPFPDGVTAMSFWAKGGAKTTQLIVEWREKDGSRWMGIVDLSTEWSRYSLTPESFIYWSDNPSVNRGKEGDHFNPTSAEAVSFGLASGISKQTLGVAHEFWVSDVRAVNDAFSGLDFSSPVLESLSPPFKTYRTKAARFEPAGVLSNQESPVDVVAPLPRYRGLGFGDLRDIRFIPILRALDRNGEPRGAAAHLFLNTRGDYAGSVWGYVGLDQRYLDSDADRAAGLAVSMLERIARGVLLANAGVDQPAYYDGEEVSLGAFVQNLGQAPVSAKLQFEIASGRRIVKSSLRTVSIGPTERGKAERVEAGRAKLPPGEYVARTTLSAGSQMIDQIEYSFRVVRLSPVKSEDCVTVRGGHFQLHGKPWFPIGVNYWPRYVTGSEFGDSWLTPQRYDPEIVEQDLALAEKLGMNLLSIQYTGGAQARGLVDFLARAGKHGIKVHAYIPGLHPLFFDPNEARPLITAARLRENPAFFAYDLGWEVHVGDYKARKAFDKNWQSWVIDRYGSIDAAEQDWGYRPESSDGTITGPKDEQLTTDGEWRVFVAAYRRFWDDEISRRYGEVREFLRDIDPHAIIGARSGYGGTGALWVVPRFPFDLASGAKHLDFTSPEGYALSGDRLGFVKGGFVTLYGRFVSVGKPVLWPEYGASIWPQCDADRLEDQRQYYENLLDMTYRSGADGSAAWWWPGGYRLGEKSDFGIVNPDGTPRPAALEIRKMAKKLARPVDLPKPDTFFQIDRDKHITGFAGVYAEFADEYVKAVEAGKTPGLRTEATGKDSSNVPLTAVGNRPYNGHNPPKYLNAEFNWIKINDRIVKNDSVVEVQRGKPIVVEASVGNTAEATWLASRSPKAGAVYLRARPSQGEAVLAPIALDTSFLADASVSGFEIATTAENEVTYEFRMVAKDRAEFGEVWRITIRPR